jgi:fibronectin type 3 domain-containing protein
MFIGLNKRSLADIKWLLGGKSVIIKTQEGSLDKDNIYRNRFRIFPKKLSSFRRTVRAYFDFLHNRLLDKNSFYKRWHSYRHHGKVHFGILFLYIFATLVIIGTSTLNYTPVYADSAHIVVSPSGYTNINSFTFSLLGDLPTAESGIAKYQFSLDTDPQDVWTDFNPPLSTSLTLPDTINYPEHPLGAIGANGDGPHKFSFRAIDNDSNIVSPLEQDFFYSGTPPQPPNLQPPDPQSNTVNSFTFSWQVPDKYNGDANKLVYHYCVNCDIPTEKNTVSTTALSVSGAFATKVGKNEFFVVAEDEAGNIDYATQYAVKEFFAYTTAPGIPTNGSVDDISDKELNQYRLAVSWTAPDKSEPDNFAGYNIYVSRTENGSYNKIAYTSETAYGQTGLDKDTRYFYRITSVDKTGNESSTSSVVSGVTSGKYRRPAKITTEPTALSKAKSASISWSTERETNSVIEFGKSEALGLSTGNSLSTYTTSHTVNLANLDSNTKYFYRAVYTDPDGNMGTSAASSFTTSPASTVSNFHLIKTTTSELSFEYETNSQSHGTVQYGVDSLSEKTYPDDNVTRTKHLVELTGLTDGTTYRIQMKQIDLEGTVFSSDEYRLTTIPLPKVVEGSVGNKTDTTSATLSVSYKTNVETTTIVRYGIDGEKAKDYIQLDHTVDHQTDITNLVPKTKYKVELLGRDKLGNESKPKSFEITTLSDTVPPKISEINIKKKVSGLGNNAEAQISVVTTTNEPSTMTIEAGRGIDGLSYNTISNTDALSNKHAIILNLGEPGLPYTYRIRMKDEAGNETVSLPRTFVAPRANKGALDYVSEVFSKSFGWLGSYIKI